MIYKKNLIQNEYNRFISGFYDKKSESILPNVISNKELSRKRIDLINKNLLSINCNDTNIQSLSRSLEAFKAAISADASDVELNDLAKKMHSLFINITTPSHAVVVEDTERARQQLFQELKNENEAVQCIAEAFSEETKKIFRDFPECVRHLETTIGRIAHGEYGNELREMLETLEFDKNILLKLFVYDLTTQKDIPILFPNNHDLLGSSFQDTLSMVKNLCIEHGITRTEIIHQILHATHTMNPAFGAINKAIEPLSSFFDSALYRALTQIIGTHTIPTDEFLFHMALRAYFGNNDELANKIVNILSMQRQKTLFKDIIAFFNAEDIDQAMIHTFTDESTLRTWISAFFLFEKIGTPEKIFFYIKLGEKLVNSLPARLQRKYATNSFDLVTTGCILANRGLLHEAVRGIRELDCVAEGIKEKALADIAIIIAPRNVDTACTILENLKTTHSIGRAIYTICDRHCAAEKKEDSHIAIVKRVLHNPFLRSRCIEYLSEALSDTQGTIDEAIIDYFSACSAQYSLVPSYRLLQPEQLPELIDRLRNASKHMFAGMVTGLREGGKAIIFPQPLQKNSIEDAVVHYFLLANVIQQRGRAIGYASGYVTTDIITISIEKAASQLGITAIELLMHIAKNEKVQSLDPFILEAIACYVLDDENSTHVDLVSTTNCALLLYDMIFTKIAEVITQYKKDHQQAKEEDVHNFLNTGGYGDLIYRSYALFTEIFMKHEARCGATDSTLVKIVLRFVPTISETNMLFRHTLLFSIKSFVDKVKETTRSQTRQLQATYTSLVPEKYDAFALKQLQKAENIFSNCSFSCDDPSSSSSVDISSTSTLSSSELSSSSTLSSSELSSSSTLSSSESSSSSFIDDTLLERWSHFEPQFLYNTSKIRTARNHNDNSQITNTTIPTSQDDERDSSSSSEEGVLSGSTHDA